jgi:hypothetical protein
MKLFRTTKIENASKLANFLNILFTNSSVLKSEYFFVIFTINSVNASCGGAAWDFIHVDN